MWTQQMLDWCSQEEGNMQSLQLFSCATGELSRETEAESQSRTGPSWQHLGTIDRWVLRIIHQYFSMSVTVFPHRETGQGQRP